MAKAIAFSRVFRLGLKVRAIRAGFSDLPLGRVLDVHGIKLNVKSQKVKVTALAVILRILFWIIFKK